MGRRKKIKCDAEGDGIQFSELNVGQWFILTKTDGTPCVRIATLPQYQDSPIVAFDVRGDFYYNNQIPKDGIIYPIETPTFKFKDKTDVVISKEAV
jgi:hypothetical protein